ncbi:transposase [Trinickia sp. EG282A]|uniref:transposase n=1 Tax=Trinickia sp. EG282A TaxID=3237013 RepID=UPI0034D28722
MDIDPTFGVFFKYSEQLRQRVVDEYLAEGVGTATLAARHGIARTVIRDWIGRYRQHGSAGLRKKFSHYDASFSKG